MTSLAKTIRNRSRLSNRTINRGRNRVFNPNIGLPGKHLLAYTTWKSMLNRCYNSKSTRYKDYGARGIKVCDRWREFSKFLEDMGDPPVIFGYRLTLERENNNGDYNEENCKWATAMEQRNNQNLRPKII